MRALLLFTLLAGSLATVALLGGYDYILANDQSGITFGVITLAGLCTAFGQARRNLLRWVIAEQEPVFHPLPQPIDPPKQ